MDRYFTRQIYRDIVMDSLRFCQQNKGLEVYAFVVMSNYIHLLTGKLSNTIKELKSFTAKKILEVVNTETESRREWMLNLFKFLAKQHKRNEKYQAGTHENPVQTGIVEKAEDYLYSSARNYAGLDGILNVVVIPMSIERIRLMRSIR